MLAALTANQITALLIDLQRFYFQKTPLEIARLDYLGREIVLLAQVPNTYGLLGRRISELAETWDRFKTCYPGPEDAQGRRSRRAGGSGDCCFEKGNDQGTHHKKRENHP